MWKKNVFFALLMIVGVFASGYFLLPANRVPDPTTHDVNWASQPEVKKVLDQLNSEFQKRWRDKKIEPTPRADNLTIIRRLSLGLIGSVPSLEEIRKIEKQPSEQQVAWWVSRLLEDKRSADYIAERLARAYVGVDNGPFVLFRRRRFVDWVSNQIHTGKPYHEIARKLLVDEGLWTDSAAVNFMTVTLDEEDNQGAVDPIRMAGRTSRAFLGMRIDCLQCHDDFLGTVYLGDEGKKRTGVQEDFHRLAAFFNDTRVNLAGIRDTKKIQHYQFKFLDDDAESIVPEGVPFRADLLPDDGTRRQKLATWITHKENRQFARAIVNRIWAIVTGRPLVEPIDDIPLHGPYPPGLETLADDLIANDYDLRRLIRLIALSEPLARDSQADFEITAAHERHWASFPLTRLRPEQMAAGIYQATSLKTIDARAHIIQKLTQFGMVNDFVKRYGDIGENEFETRSSTVTQRLILLNGKMVKERLRGQTSPARLQLLNRDDRKAIEIAYLCVFTRRPDGEEMNYFLKRFSENEGKRIDIIQDVFWELINGHEFAWNH